MAENKFHVGRKFVAFILTLIALIVLGIIDKGVGMAPYIVGLFAAYTTGNVVQKATSKDQAVTGQEASDEGATSER